MEKEADGKQQESSRTSRHRLLDARKQSEQASPQKEKYDSRANETEGKEKSMQKEIEGKGKDSSKSTEKESDGKQQSPKKGLIVCVGGDELSPSKPSAERIPHSPAAKSSNSGRTSPVVTSSHGKLIQFSLIVEAAHVTKFPIPSKISVSVGILSLSMLRLVTFYNLAVPFKVL